MNNEACLQVKLNEVNKTLFDFKDYKDSLRTTIKFEKNKTVPFHSWYPFVEGFSEDFIKSILNEVGFDNIVCLEPFSGSGTTPLTLQKYGITCHSYEVSPFMYLLSSVKLRTDYTIDGYKRAIETLQDRIIESYENEESILKPPLMSSMIKNGKRQKWLFHDDVMKGILDVKYGINQIDNKKYRDLFKVCLASILLEISNVYRNGKCVSYKKNWENIKISRGQVHSLYFDQLHSRFSTDIENLLKEKKKNGRLLSNYNYCFHGDVRKEISNSNNDYFNLVITSPPYLNSRDYTDSYMVELWMLDLVKSYSQLKKLRESTIRSHVQVKWKSETLLDIGILNNVYNEILKHKEKFWNNSLPDMISGYFNDMNVLFNKLNEKMALHGKIYFNVANSAYYGVHIPTDEIIAEIAQRNGFKVDEIRVARNITPSSQQKELIPYLRESVIVMAKLKNLY